MSKGPMPPRPKPVEIGPVRASTMKRWIEVDGQIQWYWRARRKGFRDAIWSGYGTRAYVQQRLAEEVAAGLPEQQDTKATAEIRTVGDLMDHWLDRQRQRPNLSPRTVQNYDKAARHLVAWLREVQKDRIGRDTVERYRDGRLGEDASPRLVHQELKVLRIAWRWGRECGHVPAQDLPAVKVKIDGFRVNRRTPEPQEIPLVLAELDGPMRLLVQLMAVTGARLGEICGLRGGDIDAQRKELHLDGKTGKRHFPLPPRMVELLVEQSGEPEAALFPLPTTSPLESVRRSLRGACERAGVPAFTPQALRRMVVDRMARGGVDIATAASLTGHSPTTMLQHYRQVSEDDRRRAVTAARLADFDTPGTVIPGPWKAGASD